MKDYKRLTNKYYPCVACKNGKCLEPQHHCEEREECEAYNRLFDLEDKIESGELCEREEVRKETAKEILLLLGKGFDETARKDFKDLQWYKQFCRELELRYGIELFGKTEQVGNSDKLEGKK